MRKGLSLITLVILSIMTSSAYGLGKIIFAVNAGGPQHVDVFGIKYDQDTLTEGFASDFGMRYDINRAHPQDHILYQTERYASETFGYDIPITHDGQYVLVLKFSEVYFKSPHQKIFNVELNDQLVIADLDIFGEVGHATAHDNYIPFTVKNKGKTLVIQGEQSSIRRGKISVKFVKGRADNPKINALYVMKGTLQDVPKLPPLRPPQLYEDDDEDEDDEEVAFDPQDLGRDSDYGTYSRVGMGSHPIASGPPHTDPWDFESTSTVYFPLGVSLTVSLLSLIVVNSIIKS